MERFFISLFCLFYLVSGPMSAWADCFQHTHGTVEEHHHAGVSESISDGGAEQDHFAPQFDCTQLRFDFASLVSPSDKSGLKLWDQKYRLAFHGGLSAEQTSVSAQSAFIQDKLRFPHYSFLVGLSFHLLVSVFRI
jgi:hypothetical protein